MNFWLAMTLRLVHFIALAIGVGAATAKNVLLFKCKRDHAFVPAFLTIEGPLTAQIIAGQALLTISGIASAFVLQTGFTAKVIVKIALVTALWMLGPFIDHVIAPRFRKSVPVPGAPATPEFARALNQYLFWDVTAGGIYYTIIITWMMVI